jgi:hypothetical protein
LRGEGCREVEHVEDIGEAEFILEREAHDIKLIDGIEIRGRREEILLSLDFLHIYLGKALSQATPLIPLRM